MAISAQHSSNQGQSTDWQTATSCQRRAKLHAGDEAEQQQALLQQQQQRQQQQQELVHLETELQYNEVRLTRGLLVCLGST